MRQGGIENETGAAAGGEREDVKAGIIRLPGVMWGFLRLWNWGPR